MCNILHMPINTMLNLDSLMTIFEDSIVIYVQKPFIYPFQVFFCRTLRLLSMQDTGKHDEICTKILLK